MGYQLIETVTLASAAASIEFTSIPQDGVDLLCVASLRSDATGFDQEILKIEMNGLTTGNSSILLFGDGSFPYSASRTRIDAYINGANSTANTFGNTSIYISNYTSSAAKSFSIDSVQENNAALSYQGITAGLQTSTAAITSLKLDQAFGPNFVTDSTASLYKITAD
jgi:hypothetical protein